MRDVPSLPDDTNGVLGRGDFDRIGRAELRRAARYRRPATLMMVEVDAFRGLFERFGQAAGDAVLQTLGALIRLQLREPDALARVGEAAFAVLLPETGEAAAFAVARRLRDAAGCLRVDSAGRQVPFAVNIGVAGCAARGDDLDGVLADAGAALALARRGPGIARAAARPAHDAAQ